MPLKPVQSALILALLATPVLQGCNHSNPTEQDLIQRAKDYEDKGNIKASVIELKNALKKNPNSPLARLLLGQIYLKANMGAEAEIELKKAQKLGVNRESITPQLGEALLLMGDYKRVLSEIQPSEQTSKPNLARIYQMRGEALLKTGKLQDACNLFQQSLDTDTNYPPTYWGLAQCAVANNNMDKAKAWLDTALKINDKRAKSWIFMGDLEQMNNHPQAALVAYQNAVKANPNSLEALSNHATLNIALGQLDAAKTDIEKISSLAPHSLLANYSHALLSFKQGHFSAARDSLQAIFQTAPDHLPSLLLSGAVNYSMGSYEQAASQLSKVLEKVPGNPYVRKLLAATQAKLGLDQQALATLQPLMSEQSNDTQLLTLAADIYFHAKEYAKANQMLEKAALVDPKNAAIRTGLGVSLLASGETERALADLQSASALNAGADAYKANTLLVMTLLRDKQFDRALQAIDELDKKQPNSPLTYNLRGGAYLGKNDLANARKSFEQAVAIDPAFFPAAANLAQLDLHDNKPDAAHKRFEAVLEKDKKNVQAMMALAKLAAVQKHEQEYVHWLKEAADTAPDAIPPRAKLADYYLAKKDKAKALNVVRELVNAYPSNPDALDLLGTTQLATGDNGGALATYAKLVEKLPNAPVAYLRLAMAQAAAKKVTEARASLNKALELQPDFPQARDALIRLDLAENKGGDALKIARQVQAQQPKSPVGYDSEADILMAQKQYAQAVKAYEQAMARGAGSAGLIKLHHALILAGDEKAAEQRLTSWIKQNPADVAVRGFAADYYMVSNRNRDAIAQYEELLKLAPKSVLALNNLAGLYQRERDGRALSTAEQALKLAPDNPRIQDTLGWILVGQEGQLARAINLLRKAAANAPQEGVIRYHLAVALARSGQKAEAKKELEAAISAGQKFPELDNAKVMLKGL